MIIVIAGGGKVGYALATQLIKEGHDIVLIDNDRNVVKHTSETLDTMVMYGNSATLRVQRDAGVEHADLFIAATPLDELNIMSCMIANKIGCKNTIARVRNLEYYEQMYFIRDELGLSMPINPEWATAKEIFRLTQIPGFLKRDSFAKDRVEIVEIVLREGSVLTGISIAEIHKKLRVRMLVCAVQRGDEVYIPGGDFVFEAGDKLHITAPAAELVALLHNLGSRNKKAKDVLIVGGSRIAQYLTSMFAKVGARVKIMEIDQKRCEKLAELFPSATVINADGTSQANLREQNIENMDAVITLTNIDEENLIISMFANHLGVPQVITKINRTEYSDLFQGKGIDCVISPKQICTQEIVRYVRAMQNTSGGSVLSVHNLVDDRVEALEFVVTETTHKRSVPIKELSLKPSILICCIIRMGKVIIPCGTDTIEMDDTVIIVNAAERVIVDLNDIFQEE